MGWYLLVIGIGAFYVFSFGAIVLLGRLKRFTLEDGTPFRDAADRLSFRYPPAWERRADGPDVLFQSREKDGVLRVRVRDRRDLPLSPEEILANLTREREIQWDDPRTEVMSAGTARGIHLESRATVGGDQRYYYQIWILVNDSAVAILEYHCSVLFGMVDAFYLDRLMRTLRMPAATGTPTCPPQAG
ncbi:MAG: hypothetical protein HYU36_21750 [Planctomycetes bacterium]|nr:hypothetical protein [Planctomycetota bacterium]